jgi:hypothetical protein
MGLTWGTFIFFVAEIHVGCVNIKDGAFGFWVKWFGLNLPWALSPFLFIPASILELRELYEARGAERALHAARANDEERARQPSERPEEAEAWSGSSSAVTAAIDADA